LFRLLHSISSSITWFYALLWGWWLYFFSFWNWNNGIVEKGLLYSTLNVLF